MQTVKEAVRYIHPGPEVRASGRQTVCEGT